MVSQVVPTRDWKLAWKIREAVMCSLAVVDVKDKPAQFHPREIFLTIWGAYVRKVERKFIPGTRVKNYLSIRIFKTIHVMVGITPVICLDSDDLATIPTARKQSKERPPISVFTNKLRKTRFLKNVLGEHRRKVNLYWAVEKNVVVVCHDEIMHVARWIIVGSPRHLVSSFVKFIENSSRGF